FPVLSVYFEIIDNCVTGKAPKVNRLSDSKWAKTKAKVTKQVEDIADDLIALYAERETRKGYAFSEDNDYQNEFEDSFIYAETDDQLRSTSEIKGDMQKARPMDRLLVGDVGFGKTEVALRAAFKAIQDKKQVAFLVPTTILAQQHYETMVERFEGFPVSIGLLSRFRTKKEQTQTMNELKKGQVDILVGTHRILSQDIEFQDLGLLVIDEEQRFGVKHKERLKQLKAQVDVLTLTATPIPRTLHMSMLGVRDLSVIETPPANRFPVQTYVMENNNGAIREAVLREIARNGQVFYLYNRVETIEQKVAELESLIPEARIAYAHGQMTTVQLENVLYDFIEGQYDVLVSTTIIETGVDIPNANTLFVENADYMGLSTLYQLRGRVGRSNRVAYAYFMYQPAKVLNEVSEKRLAAMREFTELGSGFKIAMRDLSIRGAGNLLGAQQHGFIDAVGFDMYSQMLEDAVAKKQGKKPKMSRTNVEIDLALDAYIPGTYITDEKQKIEIYKRIRLFETPEEMTELQEDLVDRFGDYPSEVENLIFAGGLKMNAERALIERISRKKDNKGSTLIVTMSTQGTKRYLAEQYFEALSDVRLKATLGIEKDKMKIRLMVPQDMEIATWMKELSNFIAKLRAIKKETIHE
ncbi:MAG: transcription-repair coupling factor, partial [Streptococcaceae bacterium]|nr:transcription-repair coupling factor [Streptococcaceae bacterium]